MYGRIQSNVFLYGRCAVFNVFFSIVFKVGNSTFLAAIGFVLVLRNRCIKRILLHNASVVYQNKSHFLNDYLTME